MTGGRGEKRHRKAHTTRLELHKQKGKVLTPPLMQLGLTFSSWRDSRLPEMLWAVMLTAALERDEYLDVFARIAGRAQRLGWDRIKGVEHTALANIDATIFDELMAPVFQTARVRDFMAVLLVFDNLPDRAHWERNLRTPRGEPNLGLLADAVAGCMDHQSASSTDCRWLRLIVTVVLGRMVFNTDMAERVRLLFDYPNLTDKDQIGGFIRSSEIMEPPGREEVVWPRLFWDECWRKTECIHARRLRPERLANEDLVNQISNLYGEVGVHFFEVQTHTGLDARADAIFGLTLYALYLGSALIHEGAETRLEGRLIIRTLTECFVTLAYLMHRNDSKLWKAYREHGAGQAKLAYLKLYELGDGELPNHVTRDELERLANEDIWQEFTEINLGQWANIDLRKMSIEADVKAIYDKYYGWPSGFVHGQWGAVRDTVFNLCLNPLHRFHRIPAPPRVDMGSVAPDAVKLLNLTLGKFEEAYPPLKKRIRFEPSADQISPEHDT